MSNVLEDLANGYPTDQAIAREQIRYAISRQETFRISEPSEAVLVTISGPQGAEKSVLLTHEQWARKQEQAEADCTAAGLTLTVLDGRILFARRAKQTQ